MDILLVHAQNQQKTENCFKQLQTMGIVPKSKMFKFYKNVSKAWSDLDNEFVNCRRTKKITPKYTDLEKLLHECVETFEQWSVMVALMY